ncbi:MAG: vWA domain-containing protein [Ardenticatenales bacterium]
MVIQPMPIVADIDFEAEDGAMAIGLKDRLGDMGPLPPLQGSFTGSYALALGDLLHAPVAADGWGPAATEPYLALRTYRTRWPQGGLATLPLTPSLATGATMFAPFDTIPPVRVLALWYRGPFGEPRRLENACEDPMPAPVAAAGRTRVLAAPLKRPSLDNGEVPPGPPPPAIVPGDVERVCAVPPPATPTPPPTTTDVASPPPVPTESPTVTKPPTATTTSTVEPTATRPPGPIYLPIALSEPQCRPQPPRLDVLLVLDASTSMRELTRAGRPKIDAAVAAAHDFLARLNLSMDGDHAGLVSFNAVATLDSPLTADRTALDAALARVALAQFTRIDLGLDAAAAELAGPRRRVDATAAVILLTDGRSNPVPVSEAERAAGVVKAAGARLFTIGLGQDVDAEALRAMASQAADYFEAPDGEDLGAIYGAISTALPCAPYPYWP